MKIVVAGASGFVGRALVEKLRLYHDVIALSRAPSRIEPEDGARKAVEWRQCDLFSLLETEAAMVGAECGYYLVHSMRLSAHLSQGSFEDFDLIVADNFMRSAEKLGFRHVVYLGGILPSANPEDEGKPFRSLHLESRREVEKVFSLRKVPVTALRAAMILGPGGSSFHIMTRLVQRLPVLACPSWAQTESQPIALKDVIHSLEYVLDREEFFAEALDIAGPDILSYQEMMGRVAKRLGLKRKFYPLPFFTPKFSGLWVSMITEAPRDLIMPLIESLRCEMLARPDRQLQIPNYTFQSFDEALESALSEFNPGKKPRAYKMENIPAHQVRSVQRFKLPEKWNAENVAQAYLRWIPMLMPWFVSVDVEGNWIYFRIPGFRWKLLILEYSPDRSTVDRQLFYVRGGLLSKSGRKGRLEFREVLEKKSVLAAIHNFRPAMPWYVYRWSQAPVHLWVMNRFAKYLAYKDAQKAQPNIPTKVQK